MAEENEITDEPTEPTDDAAEGDQAQESSDVTEQTETEATDEAAADTVAASDDKDPFEQFGDPADPSADDDQDGGKDKRTARPAQQAGEDDVTDQEADELDAELGGGGKLSKLVKRINSKSRRLEQKLAAATEETSWSKFEAEIGLTDAPSQVREKLPRKAVKARFQKHYEAAIAAGASPEAARGEARASMRYEVKAIVGSTRKRPLPPVKTTESGARLSPPGGAGGGRVTKPKLSPEEAFDRGNWTYPA